MQSCQTISTITPTRQDRCRAWLVERRIVFGDLALDAGMSRSTLSRIISGDRATPEHIERLVALGVPADLLPEPQARRRPGPKVRSRAQR